MYNERIDLLKSYSDRFINKVHEDKDNELLVEKWYDLLTYYYVKSLDHNGIKYWNLLVNLMDHYLSISIDEIKQELFDDEALDELDLLYKNVLDACLRKVKHKSYSLDIKELEKKLNSSITNVKEFNNDIANDLLQKINDNLDYLINDDIKNADESIVDLYKINNNKNINKTYNINYNNIYKEKLLKK